MWLRSLKKKSACSTGDAGDKGSILGQEDPLEKEMATDSSILAWIIDRGGWRALKELDMTTHACTHMERQ